jgi:Na+/pantothenate symporter
VRASASPPPPGVLLTAAIVLLYTTLGGFLAVSLTDTMQGLLMLWGWFCCPLLLVLDRGGRARS